MDIICRERTRGDKRTSVLLEVSVCVCDVRAPQARREGCSAGEAWLPFLPDGEVIAGGE